MTILYIVVYIIYGRECDLGRAPGSGASQYGFLSKGRGGPIRNVKTPKAEVH